MLGVVIFVGRASEYETVELVEMELRDRIESQGFDIRYMPFYVIRFDEESIVDALPQRLVPYGNDLASDGPMFPTARQNANLLVRAAGEDGYARLFRSAMARLSSETDAKARFDREIQTTAQALRRVWAGEAAIAWF